MRKTFIRIISIVFAAISLVSGCECNRHGPDEIGYNRVMILYSAGHNSLSGYLKEDINDLKKGYVPERRKNDILLVVSHLAARTGDYSTPMSPVLLRLYKDKNKTVVADTLAKYPENSTITRAEEMNAILTSINKQFPADHYGMVFSSHSTGWMPKGYFSNPGDYEKGSGGKSLSRRRLELPEGTVRYSPAEEEPGLPAVKSMGATAISTSSGDAAYEMDLPEFADAIPMHMDYIILDACLAGGIEVAYQLKDKCDLLCFSQAEVLAEGMDYTKLAARLIEQDANVIAVADDYFQQYAAKSDPIEQSATISVIDCNGLEPLAEYSRLLFNNYRDEIAYLQPSSVQRYYRKDKHWFYDFKDILIKSGITDSERKQLESVLGSCVLYKAATESFMQDFSISSHSGLSMYLPCNGSAYLNSFYKTLEWNKATELVD